MILCEIGENRDVIRDAPYAPLFERMRRHLHHRFGDTAIHALGQKCEQVAGLRRGVRRRTHLIGDAVLDCADQRGGATGSAEQLLQQICGGRLAIGAGDTAELDFSLRMGEDICGDGCERATAMRDFGQCNLERSIGGRVIGGRGIRDDRNGTPRDSLLDVAIAVGRLAAHRDKKGARHDATRVVLHAADDNVLADAPQHIGTAECFIQCQRARHRCGILSRETCALWSANRTCISVQSGQRSRCPSAPSCLLPAPVPVPGRCPALYRESRGTGALHHLPHRGACEGRDCHTVLRIGQQRSALRLRRRQRLTGIARRRGQRS